MVNAKMVNAESRVSQRPDLTNNLPFLPVFDDSKTTVKYNPGDILSFWILANAACIGRGLKSAAETDLCAAPREMRARRKVAVRGSPLFRWHKTGDVGRNARVKSAAALNIAVTLRPARVMLRA
jgi:hypothetical protein